MSRLILLVLALAATAHGASIGERIVGGTDAPKGAYPYQVSLRRTTTRAHFCGGSILNHKWILTSAHCVDSEVHRPGRISAYVGTNKLNEGGDVYIGHRVIVHPKWRSIMIRNDVALVELTEDIVYGDNVQPIVLPTEDFTKADYPATLTGWGRTSYPAGTSPNELQHITPNVIDQRACLRRSIRTTDENICTLTVRGEGACHGDFGGPLVADGVQIGIVSWGTPCAVGQPDVYARVWSFVDWINSNINE